MTDDQVIKIHQQTMQILGVVVKYKDLMMMYSCAIKEVQTKFEILDTEFALRNSRNPISSISTRLKSTSSIMKKIEKKGLTFTLENVKDNIRDIAGVRIICSYIDDIYTIADALLKQDDIKLINRKDYIASPKENGYRSLHLIIQIPVFFANQKVLMPVEIQIRTIAMDFWASLEHQMKYKHQIPDEEKIVAELKDCAKICHDTDLRMQEIRKKIESADDGDTETDELLEKLSKMDYQF